ncbi:hypothetical protein HG536_0G01650 [Torulaspora globosa]|uniref:Cwf19-like C-terminal domain-containing protein n=1 Tax=Torulaspora globosa TaxID=48254 RepID=A0A7G3ZLC0_9SACH|nr:uncharacterized protein HG536_0G01650 [Torulaspora globosa]QLL34306.1 hypothetical protein HG536_0G01650 [Torulaspora globosa]
MFNNIDLDILITKVWSVAIAGKNDSVTGNKMIDEICKKTRPRYHFLFGDTDSFFELEPFAWPESNRTTRSINVAAFHSKKKWAYAFVIDVRGSDRKLEADQSSSLIPNPYMDQPGKRSFSDFSSKEDLGSSSKRKKAVLPSDCHFCFTNPNVEDHMFVSIGNHAYLTTAKGPLSVPSGDMDFHGHCLIVPIKHIPKLNMGQEEFFESALRKELTSYELSVVKMNHRKFDMSTVVFEIHSDQTIHFHKQIIPVPKYLIMRFQDALDRQVYLNNERYTTNAKMNFQVFSSSENQEYKEIIGDSKKNFFQFTVYETSQDEPLIYLSQFNVNDRLDLQFGRRVVAFLMRLPKRINWSSPVCKQSKEQEIDEVKKFQKGYSAFDIAS